MNKRKPKFWTEQARANISKSLKAYWNEDRCSEWSDKMKEFYKENPNKKRCKPISVDGIIYPSASEASKAVGLSISRLSILARDPSKPNVFYV
jgi:hypothetical protein